MLLSLAGYNDKEIDIQNVTAVVSGSTCATPDSEFEIHVKNCQTDQQNFRVYYLKRTPGCPMAYCFGK